MAQPTPERFHTVTPHLTIMQDAEQAFGGQ